MKIELPLGLLSLLSGVFAWMTVACSPTDPAADPAKQSYTRTNQWTGLGSGGVSRISPRNHQYLLDIGGQNPLTEISIKSADLSLTYVLWHEQEISPYTVPFLQGTTGLSVQTCAISPNSPGRYVLLIGTTTPGDVGSYELTVKGLLKPPVFVPQQTVTIANQTWPAEGGGGLSETNAANSDAALSPKNPVYTFSTTGNKAWVDVLLTSPDADVDNVVVDSVGARVQGYVVSGIETGKRRQAIRSYNLSRGTYNVYAATADRDREGQYSLSVVGPVTSLLPVSVKNQQLAGVWSALPANTYSSGFFKTSSPGRDVYQVDIDAYTARLDLSLNTNGDLSIYDQNGTWFGTARRTGTAKNSFMIPTLTKGRYYLIVGNYSLVPAGTAYKVSVWGEVAGIKKV